MRITYFGQACTLTEAGGLKILTDPWLTEGAYFGTWFHTHLLADAGVTLENFPKDVDYIFLSHEHQDHFDQMALSRFPRTVPILICRFATTKFRNCIRSLGFENIREVESGQPLKLENDVSVTIFQTVEYTNDSAILIEHDGVRMFNETDCKLAFSDLQRLGALGIDIGFYMFSGANWYPMMYGYPDDQMRLLSQRRRASLLRSLLERVRVTKPRVAVPAAGPCTVLHPDMLWLNSEDRGIFIDPALAVDALQRTHLATQPLYMLATDVWDSASGFQPIAPAPLRISRAEYLQCASERMRSGILAARSLEAGAHPDVTSLVAKYFDDAVSSQTELVRRAINAKLAIVIEGPRGGSWTIDFTREGPEFVCEGLLPDWNYKIEVEDKLISSFVTGQEPFFEDLLLSLRCRCARRPDTFNEPLYHFLYEPDPQKLHDWYGASRTAAL